MIAFARTFEMDAQFDEKTVARAGAFYREALGGLPRDLLHLAMERIRATWKWNKLPKPADIRATVAGEMAKRQTTHMKLGYALKKITWGEQDR